MGDSRTELNTHDTPFHLNFVERIYPGSPRWWSDEWSAHSRRVQGEHGERLDREQAVIDLIHLAGDYENRKFKKYYKPQSPFLIACVNPDCPLRTWFMVWWQDTSTPSRRSLSYKKFEISSLWPRGVLGRVENADRNEYQDGLEAMAMGETKYFAREPCRECKEKRAVFGFSPIRGKWVYVLKESGESLIPYLEIAIDRTPAAGAAATEASGGTMRYYTGDHFTGRSYAFDGNLALPSIQAFTWHFFLSPVQLGPKALRLLTQAPKEDRQYAKKRDDEDPAHWGVAVLPELGLQPWTTTVKRRFQSRQVKTPFEYIPLVDAFSWVAEITEFDYLPILAAQQELIQDANEQSKAFIASTLAGVVGKVRDSENPEKFSTDPFDVKSKTVPIPDGYHGSGSNIAEAWLNRYESAMQYLTDETNKACCRVFFPVRFSLAHRIIELACQENTQDPEVFGLALAHWAHILRDMMICRAGATFTVWVAKNIEARERVPQKNILHGAGLGRGSKVAAAIGPGLPVHILAYISPAIIAGNANPAKELSKSLMGLDIETKTIGPKHVVAIANLNLNLADKVIDSYIKKLPEELDPDDSRKIIGLKRWKDGIQSFGFLSDVFKVMSLFADLNEFATKEEGSPSEWGRFKKGKEKIEAAVKVTEYLTEKANKLIKEGIESQKGYSTLQDLEFEKKLAEKMEAKQALGSIEEEIVSASRSLKALKLVKKVKAVLEGPVALVMGACEVVIKMHEMGEDWESGNPKKVVGSGLEVLGNGLVVQIAAFEMVELVAGLIGLEAVEAGAAALTAAMGPVGWFAAALILTGTLLGIFSSENDLQLFAKYCFLGRQYHAESEEARPAWMGKLEWSELKSQPKARVALLRLLTGFVTRTGLNASMQDKSTPYQETGWVGSGVGGFIFPSYVPAGAYFEVEVDIAPKGQEPTKMLGFRAIIWPLQGESGDSVWLGSKPADGNIDIRRNGEQVSRIQVHAKPNFSGPVDYNFRVRLAYDSSGKNTLPADDWVVNKSVDQSDGYNDKKS